MLLEVWLYGLKKNQHLLPANLEDTRTYRIGVSRAGAEQAYLKQMGFQDLVEVKVLSRLFPMLSRERIDLVAYGNFAFELLTAKQQLRRDQFVAIVKLEHISTGLEFALSKQTKPALTNRLKQSYRQIKSSGRYEEIMQGLTSKLDVSA